MILGVQGNLWCEHVPTAEHAEHMIWPRLLAIAEVGWSAPERKDYDDFHARVLDAVAWMQQRGYHPFDQKNAVGPRPESLDTLHCLSTGRQVAYRTPYSPKYPAAGDASLTDGLCGGWNYGDRRWQGWLDTDVELVVDLGERLACETYRGLFHAGFLCRHLDAPCGRNLGFGRRQALYAPCRGRKRHPVRIQAGLLPRVRLVGPNRGALRAAESPAQRPIPAAGFSPTRLLWSNPAGADSRDAFPRCACRYNGKGGAKSFPASREPRVLKCPGWQCK